MANPPASSLYVRLFIDEHVWTKLASLLREQGFDAVHVQEENRSGISDEEQWDYATKQRRAILTFDKAQGRFARLASQSFYEGQTFYGLIISSQLDRGELLRRVLNLLNSVTSDDMINTVRFLEDFK